ncbi:MAG TPA: phage holin family protein [Verrucomicrobiae bacterium]
MDVTHETPHLAVASKRLAQRAMTICENRFELLVVELQEQAQRAVQALLLSIALLAFTLLTGVALTLLIAVACWNWSPLAALIILTVIYAGITAFLVAQLIRLRRDWEALPATLEQLRKDRECLGDLN